MATLNRSGEEIRVKVVYYGPGSSGKTTNFDYLHAHCPARFKSNMLVTTTRTDRTLSFEMVPNELSDVNGFQTKFVMFTVPGQVCYNATRKLVLDGVDALVFVADSSRDKLRENIENLRDLEENLNENGISLDHIPWVIQYNKRDLPDATPVEELHKHLNLLNVPAFEAVATQGRGVYETFKETAAILHTRLLKKFEDVIAPVGPEGNADGARVPAGRPGAAEGTEDEVTGVVDAAFREVGGEKKPAGPKTQTVAQPAPEKEIGAEKTDKPAPRREIPPKKDPIVVMPRQKTEELPKQKEPVDLWAQSVGSAKRADSSRDSSAQPPASAREQQTPPRPAEKPAAAGKGATDASIPDVGPGHIPTTTTLQEEEQNPAETFSFEHVADAPQPEDIGRLVEFDEETTDVPSGARKEHSEFIKDPMQRRADDEEESAIEHVERPPQVSGERGSGSREEFEIKVPVLISRSQVKKSVPLKLVLEIQVVDD